MTPLPPARTLPSIDLDNKAFWSGGEAGRLMIYRCSACRYYVHPPVRFCPKCESRAVGPEAVSGRGRVETFTVNHKQWVPGLSVPYVLALITIAEQDDVRLVANILNVAPAEIRIGMPVKVLFEQHGDVWVPLFEPDSPP